jgi:prephenate dehydratase
MTQPRWCEHEPPRVAFQGELGAYGDEAIRLQWNGAAQAVPAVTFDDVVLAVASGAVEFGVVPVWNTVVGDVVPGCEAVRSVVGVRGGLAIVGDVHVNVRHHLIALPGTTLEEIHCVTSHPVALAQCQRFFDRHPRITLQPAYDTAGAVRDIALCRTPGVAAIAGLAAAERYGLVTLAGDVQDVPDNVTHFVVLARLVDAHRSGSRQL